MNRELAVLRALYNRCGDWGKYEGEKPVGKVRPMKALMLRWSDIDLRRGLLTVQSAYAKSGKTRTDPLNRPALAALPHVPQSLTGKHWVT